MGLLAAFLVFLAAMAACIALDISMLIALAIGLICFALAAVKRGHSVGSVAKMAWHGMRRSFVVMKIFIFIGLITAMWRASGTIAFFVYHGVGLITPPLFVVCSFVLAAIVSYALGTSFGVIGTVGVIMIAMARSGGVSPLVEAGALMSGAYFGDRCSPASSCANVVATATDTKLYGNIRAMLRSGVIPTVATLIAFAIVSAMNPLENANSVLLSKLASAYTLTWPLVIPAALMLILPLFKIDVKLAMAASALAAFIVALTVQGQSALELIKFCFVGFIPQDSALNDILSGGGLLSMVNVAGIVMLSSSYSGIFDETNMLKDVTSRLVRVVDKLGAYNTTLVAGTLSAMVFCNQTIATMMTAQLMKSAYREHGLANESLALDISDSLVVTSGLLPWVVACAVPLSMLGVGVGAVPFCFLLYFTPLYRVIGTLISKRGKAERDAQPSH